MASPGISFASCKTTLFRAALSSAATMGAAKLLDVTGRVGSVAWKDGVKFVGIYQATQALISSVNTAKITKYAEKGAPAVLAAVSGVVAHFAMNSRFINSNLSWKVSAVLTTAAFVGGVAFDKLSAPTPSVTPSVTPSSNREEGAPGTPQGPQPKHEPKTPD